MYIPHQYKNEDLETVKAFLVENNFGILVNQVDGKPWATHIPLQLEKNKAGKDILVSHISKANPQSTTFNTAPEVLCIFNGPHTYISSSWYQQEEVPTWDYIAVHVYGKLHVLDEEEVMQSLHRLVDAHETVAKHPVSLDHMSESTLKQVRGVVGFQIVIDRIEAAYKLSQGRPNDHAKIIAELREQGKEGATEIAANIEKLATFNSND